MQLFKHTALRPKLSRAGPAVIYRSGCLQYSNRPEDENEKMRTNATKDNQALTDTSSRQDRPMRSTSQATADFVPISLDAWCKRHKQAKFTDGLRQLYTALGHAARLHPREATPRKTLRLAVPNSSLVRLKSSRIFSAQLVKAVYESNLQLACAEDYIHRIEVTDFLYRKSDTTAHKVGSKDASPVVTRGERLCNSTRDFAETLKASALNFVNASHQCAISARQMLKEYLLAIPPINRSHYLSSFLERIPHSPTAAHPNRLDWNVVTLSDVQEGKFDFRGKKRAGHNDTFDLRVRCRMTIIPNPRRFYSSYEWCFKNIKVVGLTENASTSTAQKDADVVYHYRHMAATYLASNPLFIPLLRILPKPITLDASMILRQNTFISKRISAISKSENDEAVDPSFTDILPSKVTYMEVDLPGSSLNRGSTRQRALDIPRKLFKADKFLRGKNIARHFKHFGRWCKVQNPAYWRAGLLSRWSLFHNSVHTSLLGDATTTFRVVSVRNDEHNTYPMWALVENKSTA